ncbi:MAG TPA: FliA/WhiG family RNA polymerase sigma factor [Chloroflexota bacterium]|nr:FliA/WhiG family RNA polymerase sigma factor [Chloroflexota bacterium]
MAALLSKAPEQVRRPPCAFSAAERERMIVRYAPLVRQVVGRLMVVLPQALDRDDLLGYGAIGLIEAVDRFNPSLGTSFEGFAAERIRGSVIDALRATDWVPRTARKRARDIQRTFTELEESLGRPPADEEVAEALDLSLTQLHRAMADAVTTMVSLQRPMRASDGEEPGAMLIDSIADDEPGPSQALEQAELHSHVLDALRHLDERERLVLSLYYEQSLTLKEIGQVLEISESRVWQLHARAIMRIRVYIGIETGRDSLRKGA